MHAVVSEWLRRWTRNPLGSARTGSNPVYSERFFFLELNSQISDHLFVQTEILKRFYSIMIDVSPIHGPQYFLILLQSLCHLPNQLLFEF